MLLPGEIWAAILSYLVVSGRLASMLPESYIFVALAGLNKPGTGFAAQDWKEGRWLSNNAIKESLKLYGRLAGIPDHKLNFQALRGTAIRMRLDAGDSLEEIKVFLDTQESRENTKFRLRYLPELPPEQQPSGVQPEAEPPLPDRNTKPFQPGDGFIHGYYARSLPHEAILEVLAEDIHGFEQEFMGLRTLARGLIDRMHGASQGDRVCLGEAYTMAASRLGEMVKTGKQQAESENQDPWAEELLAMLDAFLEEQGSPPISDTVRREALESDLEQELAAQLLREEIASVRYVLRNTFQAAIDAVKIDSYLHLVDLYGKECIKLVRLLKHQPNDNDRLEAFLEKALDQAVKELMEEWGL
jgi:hypothetical protein